MSSKRKSSTAPRQSDLIVVDSSDDDEKLQQRYEDTEKEEEEEEEEEEDFDYRKANSKKPAKKPSKKASAFGNFVMSREERLLNGLPVTDDEDDESGDKDDDYDDGDDSYGDGSRAFAPKRARLTTSKKTKQPMAKPSSKAKRPSQSQSQSRPTLKTKMMIKSKPPSKPLARSVGKKRARQSESESGSESQSESESESDGDFQRRRTAVTLTQRNQGGAVVKTVKKSREEPLRASSAPQVARKSAPVKYTQAKPPAKRSRHVESDEEESSEEEEDESEESEPERRRPPPKKTVEIEISDDSESESDEELPPPPKKKTKMVQRPVPAVSKKPSSAPVQQTARKTVPKSPVQRPRSPSPSSESSSPSPPPTPPPRPAAPRPVISKAPVRPQPESPVAAPSRRSRGVDTFAEKMTLAEIQAQEREMARFAAERKRLEKQMQATSSKTKVTNNSRAHAAKPSRPPAPARRRQRKESVSSDPESGSESESSIAVRRTSNHASVQAPKTLSKKQSSNSTPSYIPPPLRDGFATSHTPSVVTSVKTAMEASMAVAEKAEHTPIAHNTTWRRLRFARAPMNLLPVASSSASKLGCRLPFTYVTEPELHDIDASLEKKSEMIANTFQVKTEHRLVEENQQLVNMRVQAMISQTLPVLEKCHKIRVAVMIREMRENLPWSKQPTSPVTSTTPGSRTKRQIGTPLSHGAVDLAPIERVHAKRGHLKLTRPRGSPNEINRLVGRVKYVQGIPMNAGGGDDSVFERAVAPETVIELPDDIAPMRRSCTWVSVTTNFHVDDNPILRYIPHLGDKARVNIDPKRYESTTLDKDQRIVIEVDDEEEGEASTTSGEKSLSERLEQWRIDTANLKVESSTSVDDEVKEYLLCKVVQMCGETNQLFKALETIGGFAQPETDYDQVRKREGTIEKVTTRLAAFQESLSAHNEEECVDKLHKERVADYLTRLAEGSRHFALSQVVDTKTKPTVSHRLSIPHQPFDSNYAIYPNGKGVRQKGEIDAVGDWYRTLFCRRCYTYDCEKHGIEHPRPSRRSDPVHPVVRKSGVGLLRAPASSEEKPKTNGMKSNGVGVIELASSSSSSEESEDEAENENDDAQSVMSGSVEGEVDGDGDVTSVRRSRRSQTQADSMASANLRVQGVIVQKERRKQQRQQAKQLKKLVRPVDDSEYLDDSYQTVLGPMMDVLLSADPQATCSEHCWKASSARGDPTTIPEPSEIDQVMLRKLMAMLGTNACVLSSLLRDPPSINTRTTEPKTPPTTSCAAIRRYIDQQKSANVSLAESPAGLHHSRLHKSSQRRHQQSRSSAVLHSGNSELIRRTRMHRTQQDKVREHSYKPCDHDGVCDASCDCNKRGHDCDSACCCSRDCANRNHGCKCVAGECRGKNCACYVANRECHPDFCFSCGAHEAAVMEFDEKLKRVPAEHVDICRNVNMLRGVRKKIGVAFSATHGWGAYVLEPVRKGDFVYEYTGALISDDEAERRGNVYDAMMVSYLFDINSDEVVDAMRKGNKIKFANHRPQKTANLETKILTVRGEHRIAMFAKWDLHVGEELFFDYGYTNETAPEWSQERAPHNIHYAGSDLDDDDDEDEMLEILDVTRASEEEDEEDDA